MYIVSYDISKNKRRRKVAKVMENYGRRVQYSVFECTLDAATYRRMYSELCELLDLDEESNDSIRIYSLCKNCQQKTVVIGVKKDDPAQEAQEQGKGGIIVIG